MVSQSALDHCLTGRLGFLVRRALILVSTTTMSWSDIPGTVSIEVTSPGLLVQYRSRSAPWRVGSRCNCSIWCSSKVSMSLSHRSFLSLPGLTKLHSQSISPALKSPPRMIGLSVSRLFRTVSRFSMVFGDLSLGGGSRHPQMQSSLRWFQFSPISFPLPCPGLRLKLHRVCLS